MKDEELRRYNWRRWENRALGRLRGCATTIETMTLAWAWCAANRSFIDGLCSKLRKALTDLLENPDYSVRLHDDIHEVLERVERAERQMLINISKGKVSRTV